MSAPVLWIILPGLTAGVLVFFNRRKRLTASVGIVLALLLSGLAEWANIGTPIHLIRWNIVFTDTLTVFGRRFILDNTARPALLAIYLVTAFWMGGILASRVGRLAAPLALAIVALLTAAFAVEPFLYAALLIEMAVLACIPLLTPPGKRAGRGLLRFLVFQTLGMMLLLFTGWIMSSVDANPTDQALAARAAIFLGLGFALLLAVIPFQTWIPMIAEEAHPYAAGLIFLMLPEVIMLFGLGFLDRYAWLRQIGTVYTALRLAGVGSVFIGGWWAASQRHLGRMLGFSVIVEIGYSLLAVGATGGLPLHFALLMPRALGFGVYSLALSALRLRTGGLDFQQVQGAAHRLPLAAAGIVVSQFSLAGFPLLAGFPVHLAIWKLAGQQFPWSVIFLLAGSGGLMAAGLRSLLVLLTGPNADKTAWAGWQHFETRLEAILLGIGISAFVAAGIFSQWYFPFLTRLGQGLEHLVP